MIKPPSRTLMRKLFGGNDHQFDLTECSNGLKPPQGGPWAPDIHRVLAPYKWGERTPVKSIFFRPFIRVITPFITIGPGPTLQVVEVNHKTCSNI